MNHNLEIFIHMQYKMSHEVLEEIFPSNYEHYIEKWIGCKHNLLIFMALLDHVNNDLIMKWGQSLYTKCI